MSVWIYVPFLNVHMVHSSLDFNLPVVCVLSLPSPTQHTLAHTNSFFAYFVICEPMPCMAYEIQIQFSHPVVVNAVVT